MKFDYYSEELFPKDKYFGGGYDFEKADSLTTREIKNCFQPIPGNLSLRCIRDVLVNRGEDPHEYHNT